ncbi:unnamed protein product [Nippostrongylus brasiliensis]|uniref:DDE_Tnp_Tn3 domain-containing protein n=1 Tax=Nippostrongylus brasiliensis TaxID=27835 RepID=A0A0N4XVT4_NIPBR|nr:unnamed protein product [Nippostrongylus brasiliensis]
MAVPFMREHFPEAINHRIIRIENKMSQLELGHAYEILWNWKSLAFRVSMELQIMRANACLTSQGVEALWGAAVSE